MTAPAQDIVGVLAENLRLSRRLHATSIDAVRRDVTRELDRQMWRAIWRAERRGRWLPLAVRQSAPWVNGQRRIIAWELFRALRSLGAGPELARVVAVQACEKFPRDGIVIATADPRKPRENGRSPRQLGVHPRARGDSPRQRGTSPRQERQRRGAADLSSAATAAPRDLEHVHAPPAGGAAAPPDAPPRPIDELAPGWSDVKAQLLEGLSDEERLRARNAGAAERERVEKHHRRSNHPPPTTDRRS